MFEFQAYSFILKKLVSNMVLFLFSIINKSALPNKSIIALFMTRIQNMETHPYSSTLKLKDRNITL